MAWPNSAEDLPVIVANGAGVSQGVKLLEWIGSEPAPTVLFTKGSAGNHHECAWARGLLW